MQLRRHGRLTLVLLVAALTTIMLAAATAAAAPKATLKPADTVYINGKVVTVDKKFSIKQLFGDVTPRFLRQKLALAVTGVRLHSQPNTDPVAFGKRHGIAADTC